MGKIDYKKSNGKIFPFERISDGNVTFTEVCFRMIHFSFEKLTSLEKGNKKGREKSNKKGREKSNKKGREKSKHDFFMIIKFDHFSLPAKSC